MNTTRKWISQAATLLLLMSLSSCSEKSTHEDFLDPDSPIHEERFAAEFDYAEVLANYMQTSPFAKHTTAHFGPQLLPEGVSQSPEPKSVTIQGTIVDYPDDGSYYYENILGLRLLLNITSINGQQLEDPIRRELHAATEIEVPAVGDVFEYEGYVEVYRAGFPPQMSYYAKEVFRITSG